MGSRSFSERDRANGDSKVIQLDEHIENSHAKRGFLLTPRNDFQPRLQLKDR